MKRIFTLLILAAGVVVLLCMARPQRTPAHPDAGDTLRHPSSFRKAAWHRPAQPSFEVQIPIKLGKLKSLVENDAASGIEALEEFLTAEDSREREEAFAWLADHPAGAASWIESLSDGPVRNGFIERGLSEVTHRNPTAALAVAELLTTPDLRDAALTSVLRRWASDSPIEALSAIVAREEWRDSPLTGRAFVAAATSSPRRIRALLALIPAQTLDNSFLAIATESLLAKDPDAIPLWFESVQTAEQRSTIAETVMLHAGRNQPDLAFLWATQLSDPTHRTGALQNLLHKAAQRNPDAASALFDSPWLSAEDRESLPGWFTLEAAPE